MKFGIENLKALMIVILAFVNVGDKMGHENNWASRMTHLFGFFPHLLSLGSIKWEDLDEEIKDVDDVEKAELLQTMKEKFDIIDDKLEEVVEEGLEIAANIGGFVKTVKSFIEKVKTFFNK